MAAALEYRQKMATYSVEHFAGDNHIAQSPTRTIGRFQGITHPVSAPKCSCRR
jgi:hypothetical protein